ncbi:UDP-N-acetylmuramate dehydrogenase [[Clostridium] polysaccharolyticum]|uniref:UDP-N-acetylenolpyruvoylglucosamine reductase n=1 Tax=[Clostridium] polysaccharolyticum TaxID=29364 RepID=A0A1I0C5X7_9FIRM|nr:UDP-N-acetylmuramate dehydrogenase [[Clostridium] polysaccharolyticum]SET14876.1 UDP-N-acetylmuramate dehydrogenase [[Clostridium] polysaccharolyticum]
MYREFKNELCNKLKEGQLKEAEPMKRHTTFRIGGPARFYAVPKTEEELTAVIQMCRQYQMPFFILGNGSNLLVSDEGFDGVIIEIKEQFAYYTVEEKEDRTFVTAGAGILLSRLASEVAKRSLKGFEFASGIPGTLGGAVAMNAGAYGGEIKDCIVSAKILTRDGCVKVLYKEDLELGYRKSIITRTADIVLEAAFAFEKGNEEEIHAQMKDFNRRRREKQPLEYPSAGSTFKRPEGYFAGKLIMDAGLRGFRVGDVMVSEKHCGFVVNVGNGTATQVKELIEQVSLKVENQFGVRLEPEVRFVGRF